MKGVSVDSSLSVRAGRCLQKTLVLWCALTVLTLVPSFSAAQDTDFATAYIQGLRERGWHDVVLEYLGRADQDPVATTAFLKRVPFERAVTNVEIAKQSISQRQRELLLDKACEEFITFAEDNQYTPLEVEALSQASNLLLHRGLLLLSKSDQLPPGASGQRQALQTRCLELFGQASKALKDLNRSCADQLEKFPKAAVLQKNPELLVQRTKLENTHAESQFLRGKIIFDQARLYEKGSREYEKTLQSAAKSFAQLAEKYQDRLIGFLGQLYQGRCFQELGEMEEALKAFDDIVDRPISNPDFRKIVARAFRRRAEVYLEIEQQEQAIQEARDFLNDSQTAELDQPEWLAVMFRLANAYESFASSPDGQGESKRLLADARKLLREVANSPGEFQSQARAALASTSGVNQTVNVKTFEEAYDAGRDSLSQASSSELAAKLAKENNPSAMESLQSQATQHKTQALTYFETCLRLADEDSALEKLLAARYYVCWLYWEDGRAHEAALMGSFLARRYPEDQYSRLAAKIALAAYERIYNEALRKDRTQTEFESKQLNDMAQLLITRWPNSDESLAASNLLLNAALKENRISDAEALLEQLPPASRSRAELSLGSSLWQRYLQVATKNQLTPNSAALQQKTRAMELMARGYNSLRELGSPSATEAVGLLYLAQSFLQDGKYARAIEVLEDPVIGPLTLVRKGAAVAERPAFVMEVYKAALRAFYSVTPPEREKGQLAMRALEAAFGDEPTNNRKLTGIYLRLGVQIQQQIEELSAAGKTAEANTLAGSFEDLIEQVNGRAGDGDNWKTQNWIAQTNLQLGQGLRGEAAERHLNQAEEIYQSLLAKAEQDASFAPSADAILAIRKRLADVLLARDRYEEAFAEYTEILKTKPTILELQQNAAAALMKWGVTEENPQKLEEAILGTVMQANRKNLVWGWLRLASLADNAKRKSVQKSGAGSPQAVRFHNLFFSARLQVAQSRFEAAKLATGAERQKQLNKSKQSIKTMQRLYPDLGGPRWKDAYLNLLKDIESLNP